MAEKKKISLRGLFLNNKFVLAFSIVAAVIIWIVASMTVSPEDTRTIEGIKVTFEQDEDAIYKAFGYEDTYVDVTVKGRRYLVSSGALSPSDITVSAAAGYVDSSGTQTLRLSASVNNGADITITELSQNTIKVYYDTEKTATFPIEVRLDADILVADGCISETPITSMNSVTVKGPSSQINNIEKFAAPVGLDFILTETTTVNAGLETVTANGKSAKYISFEDDVENFTVTIPVFMVKELPISVIYLNMPSYYEKHMPEVNIYPKTVNVAASKSVLDEMDTLNIGSISFSKLTNTNNKFRFSLSDIDEVKILDNVDTVSVNVNCYPMRTKKVKVDNSNITLLNLPDGYKAKLADSGLGSVTIVGPADDLAKTDETTVSAKVDLSKVNSTGTKTVKAEIYINGSDKIWAYGEYNVDVKISD